jgi:drug/metabolite transporter (DMT)-like permease
MRVGSGGAWRCAESSSGRRSRWYDPGAPRMSWPEHGDNARRPLVTSWRSHAALLVVQAAFSVGAVEGKLVMKAPSLGGGGVDPFALAMARMAGAALFFQVLVRALGALRPVSRRDLLRIGGLAILGIVLNQALFLVGLRITTAFASAVLGVTIPVFTAALSVAFGVEAASAQTAAGLALAIGGVLWLTGGGTLDMGALAIAANCFSYSLYIVLSKSVIERVGALTLVTWLFTWGAVLFAPLGAPALVRGSLAWSSHTWALVAVVVAVPTIVAYSANAWALGRSSPTLVTVYVYLQPLLTAVLQWLQLGEMVTARAVLAAVLIFSGVIVIATRRGGSPPSRPTSASKGETRLSSTFARPDVHEREVLLTRSTDGTHA